MEIKGKAIEIITGRYGRGTPEDNRIVDQIFGEMHAKERFGLYFHWYNIIHEMGHGIMCFNNELRPHPVDEEQLVNDFAVAFWLYYGEEAKICDLSDIVSYALSHLRCPADAGITPVEWAREKWGTEEVMNFNNYGWFQFSCVADSLHEKKPLESVLALMGIKDIIVQPSKTYVYSVIGEEAVPEIIEKAVCVLHEWGAALPKVYSTFDNDPNRHMCNIIEEEVD